MSTTVILTPVDFYRCDTESGELWHDQHGRWWVVVGETIFSDIRLERTARELLVAEVERLSYEMRLRNINQAVERANYYLHNGS